MVRKICPVCDQLMKGTFFCEHCHSFVTPEMMDVSYFLNERHPQGEEDCEYHTETEAEYVLRQEIKEAEQQKARKRPAIPNVPKPRPPRTEAARMSGPSASSSGTSPGGAAGRKKQASVARMIFVCAAIWIICQFLAAFMAFFM